MNLAQEEKQRFVGLRLLTPAKIQTILSMKLRLLFTLAASAILASPLCLADAPKPLRVLLVAGGCCHDYLDQPIILKEGLEARANVKVEIAYNWDKSTKMMFSAYDSPDWAKGLDAVIHDECSSDVMDHPYVDNIVNAHKNGLPGVNLHCAMHSYRKGIKPNEPQAAGSEGAIWYDYLGLQSAHHGKQLPIEITFVDTESPITKGMANWTTVNEELYNNVWKDDNFKNWPAAHALARGKQNAGDVIGENNNVVAWTNEYGPKKTRVFSTTIGHNNATVGDDRYLDLVTRGLLWTCNKLGDDGKPLCGYEAQKADPAAAAAK
jgi:type 1 glutamine amidotransferase